MFLIINFIPSIADKAPETSYNYNTDILITFSIPMANKQKKTAAVVTQEHYHLLKVVFLKYLMNGHYLLSFSSATTKENNLKWGK